MHRQEVIGAVLELTSASDIIVSNIADATFELYKLGDRPRNFYMLGSFGLAPSIALGLALARKERVVAINGDGALLYSLGCLSTEGRYAPGHLVHVVVDNGSHGATGYQPTATSVRTDVAAVAAGCGLESTTVHDLAAFRMTFEAALGAPHPAVVVAKVGEMPPEPAPLPPLSGEEIRERFMAAL